MHVRLLALVTVVSFVVGVAPPVGAADESTMVFVFQPGGLTEEVARAAEAAAARAGGRAAVFHRGTLGLIRATRGPEVLQEVADGFRIPMDSMAVPENRAMAVFGRKVADALRRGEVAMSELSASLRGAQVGDRLELRGWDGLVRSLRIGAVVPDRQLASVEIVVGTEIAAEMGFDRPSTVAVWGLHDRDSFEVFLWKSIDEDFLSVRGIEFRSAEDRVLPTAEVKARFGEFSYRDAGGDQIVIGGDWVERNILTVELPGLGLFRCHRLVLPYLRAAVRELEAAGLMDRIDEADFQRAGGCYNPRLIRGGDKGGAVSRHAWGIAVDINPSSNPYGGAVTMDPGVVEVVRRWGFAWGGGWSFPDGGHFEWTHIPWLLGRGFSPGDR